VRKDAAAEEETSAKEDAAAQEEEWDVLDEFPKQKSLSSSNQSSSSSSQSSPSSSSSGEKKESERTTDDVKERCLACEGQHKPHDRESKGCRLYQVPLRDENAPSCKACRGIHTAHTWQPGCRLHGVKGQRKKLVKAFAASIADVECRIYTQQEVMQSTGVLRELFAQGARKEIEQMLSTGTLRPCDETQARELERQGDVLPSTLVWSIKQTSSGKVGKLRWTCAGNRQSLPISAQAAATSNPDTIAVRLATIASVQRGWSTDLLDVTAAFLNAPLHESEGKRLGVRIPKSVHATGLLLGHRSAEILMSMYGLRSSPAAWNQHRDCGVREISDKLANYRIIQSALDENIWLIQNKQGTELCGLLLAYVDDFLITGTTDARATVTDAIKQRWTCGKHTTLRADLKPGETDVGEFVGIEMTRTCDGITMTQGKFIKKLLERYGLEQCNPRATPMDDWTEPELEEADKDTVTAAQEMVGSLLWLSCKTRVDVSYAVQVLSSFATKCPRWTLSEGKKVLRYLAGTVQVGLNYTKTTRLDDDDRASDFDDLRRRRGAPLYERDKTRVLVQAFADASFCPDVTKAKQNDETCDDTMVRAVTGYVIVVGGQVLYWKSNKQSTPTSSTAEAELCAQLSCLQTVQGVKDLLECVFGQQVAVRLHCDSQAAIAIIKQQESVRTRHLALRAVLIRHAILCGYDMQHEGTKTMLGDILTKPLQRTLFEEHRRMLDLCNLEQKTNAPVVQAKAMTVVSEAFANALAKALVNAGVATVENLRAAGGPTTMTMTDDVCPACPPCPDVVSQEPCTQYSFLAGVAATVAAQVAALVAYRRCCPRRQTTMNVRDANNQAPCTYDQGEPNGRFRYLGHVAIERHQWYGRERAIERVRERTD